MYNLHKIIIMGNYDLEDRQSIETVVMITDGMRIEKILYISEIDSIPNKVQLKEEIKSELYSDMYDEGSLKIKVKEAINGMDAINKVSSFILKNYTTDTLLYFYDPNDGCYDYLEKILYDNNGSIYLENYNDIFSDNTESSNDIYTIMQNNNMKIENLIKDNKISMIYFLSGLVEKLFSK